MRTYLRFLSILLALLLVLSGCQKKGEDASPAANGNSGTNGTPVSADFAKTDADMFTDRDKNASFNESSSVLIELKGNTATASSDTVLINGSTVTITGEASYIITGTLNDGQIIVNVGDSDKPQLILRNAHVTSSTSAPLLILTGDKVFLTLEDGTSNTLTNGGSLTPYGEINVDGTLFSKQDLTLNGTGSLAISSPAGHGIVCKDDLVFTGGIYTITAASHGVDANDSVRIADAALTVQAGKDGIHAENTDDATLGFVYISGGELTLTAAGDGIDAAYTLQIESGTLQITASGGTTDSSMKGLKATSGILVSDGTISITSDDDAVHSNGSVTINGGTWALASGDDGIHADETLTVTAGQITVSDSYEGLEALNIALSGGTIRITADDDGLNAAGGTDSSGFGGSFGGDMFGGGFGGRPGGSPGMGGGGTSASNGSIVISGGTHYIKAGGDGLDANGTLSITGGHVTVCGPTQGDTAVLDYDATGTITGGTFIGTGSSNMAQTLTPTGQGIIAVRLSNQSAGTAITLTDKDGNTVMSVTPELSFGLVILSSPQIVSGETYTLSIGTLSEEIKAS